MRPDERHWIMNPAGHRQHANATDPHHGDTVEFLGRPAVVIKPDLYMEPGEWICDICNAPILTSWAGEPFPVPVDGTYALCADHRERVEQGPDYDSHGDPIAGSTLGPWPAAGCTCPPCARTTEAWARQLPAAYGLAIYAEDPSAAN